MCLIPWITEGDKRTIVTNEHDFKSYPKAVSVVDFNPDQFKTRGPNATYDLHVGGRYLKYRDFTTKDVGDIILAPGEGALIQTKEQVHFPNCTFGLIIPKEGELRKGLWSTTTKVDPGYGLGRLHIAVFNHSEKPEKLPRGAAFCTLCLFEVSEELINEVIPYSGSKDLTGRDKEPPQWPKWIKANLNWIAPSIISSIVAVVVALWTRL